MRYSKLHLEVTWVYTYAAVGCINPVFFGTSKIKEQGTEMKVKSLCTLMLCITPLFSFAHNITLNQTIPNVAVSEYGELFVEGDEIAYKAWDSSQLAGKVRVIQAIAGRKSAKKMNADLMTAITASQFSQTDYQTTTIINQDDSIWGTGSFVKSSAEDSKQEFPWSSIILDENGVVAQNWQLAEESSAIVVLDKESKVLFVKEGALDEQEIKQVITLISEQL